MGSFRDGYRPDMDAQRESEDPEPIGGASSDRVAERSHLLPEEEAVGSDDPEQQAATVLADSDERTEDPDGTRLESAQTPDPESDPEGGSEPGEK